MEIYLDNAATTKPSKACINMITDALTNNYGNPSSLHSIGLEAEKAVTFARKEISSALSCNEKCITFTSGATEANNMVVNGVAKIYGKRKMKNIVVSAIEHPSVLEPIKNIAEIYDYDVRYISPNSDGVIDPTEFFSAVDNETFFASCMLVNNETGAIQPIKEIFSAIKRRFPDCLTHCDAVQGFTKIPIKAPDLFADFIVVSGHKVHAAKGVGALYVKTGTRIAPLILGGGQEKNLRSGTESVPLISGFGGAVSDNISYMKTASENANIINNHLRTELSKLEYIKINSAYEKCSPFILNFSVLGIRSEIMLHYLEEKKIYVSSGSACSKGKHTYVLSSMGISDFIADCAIRVSLSKYTTLGEVDMLISEIKNAYAILAKIKMK